MLHCTTLNRLAGAPGVGGTGRLGWGGTSGPTPAAHGFERVGALPEVFEADHLAAPEGPHLEVTELGGRAASAPDSALKYAHKHAVPRVGDCLRFDRQANPGLEKTSHVPREALGAEVVSGVGKFGRQNEQDEGVKYVDARPKVALTPPVVDVPDSLHVLLRHRLLPPPHGFEGLGAEPKRAGRAPASSA